MYVYHLCFREKRNKYLIKTTVLCGDRSNVKLLGLHMYICGRRLLGALLLWRTAAVLYGVQELVKPCDNFACVSVRRVTTDLIHFTGNKIRHLQHMLYQLKMRYIVRVGLSQIIENIFQLMRNSRDIVKHHNT